MTQAKFQLTRPRGARPGTLYLTASSTRFQLTRPRGARRLILTCPTSRKSFNSRAREGRDQSAGNFAEAVSVSTHAPARGATRLSESWRGRPGRFNSRAREGRDHDPIVAVYTSGAFQLTRPRGARLDLFDDVHQPSGVSTHAPARGAT